MPLQKPTVGSSTKSRVPARRLSVILPAYNESEHIHGNVLETVKTLVAMERGFELIVVDDGSSDETWRHALLAKAVSYHPVKIIRYDENRGKGHALLCGAAHSRGDFIAFIDSDLDLHPFLLVAFLQTMEDSRADVVVGSKFHPQSTIVKYPLTRRILSFGYYLLVRALFGLPVRDTQTGLKLFRRPVLEAVAPLSRSEKFSFDVEILCLAHSMGFKIVEAPVTLQFKRRFGRIRPGDITYMFLDTLRIFARLRIISPIHAVLNTHRERFTGIECHDGGSPSSNATRADDISTAAPS